MTSATTGDIETIRLLNEAVKKHRGKPEGWRRFGALLAARRTQLGYPDGKREQLVRDRSRPGGLTARDAYKIEHGIDGDRKAWPTQKLIAAADVYAILPRSIPGALDGGDIEPVPAPRAARLAAAPVQPWSAPAAKPTPAVLMSGVLSPQVIAAAAPYATRIFGRKHALAVTRGIAQPSGHDLFILDLAAEQIEDVFPGDRDASYSAASRWGVYADDLPEDDRVWFIAAKHVTEAAETRPDMNVG